MGFNKGFIKTVLHQIKIVPMPINKIEVDVLKLYADKQWSFDPSSYLFLNV